MESSLIDGVVSNVPSGLRSSIDDLLRRPVSTRDRLLADLDAYTRRIDDAARRRPDLDVNLAEGILRACRTLLDDGWPAMSADERRLVQIACDYYVDAEDHDGDLQSVHGFDDDAEVLNLVLDGLQRPELKVRI